MDERIEIHRALATIASDMKHMAKDLGDVKDMFSKRLAELEEGLNELQVERKVAKARMATVATFGGGLGAILVWVAERIIG